MGDFVQNMVIVFVPEDQQTLAPAVMTSLRGEAGPFDFERIMPGGRGGGLAGLLIDALESQEGLEKLSIDPEDVQAVRDRQQMRWGCQSNAIFFDENENDSLIVEELDDHYGYEDQPKSIKINWRFYTKNGVPEELAERFARHASSLGLGVKWYTSSPDGSRWNPVTDQWEDQWDLLAESEPEQISETQRMRNVVTTDNLFDVTKETS